MKTWIIIEDDSTILEMLIRRVRLSSTHCPTDDSVVALFANNDQTSASHFQEEELSTFMSEQNIKFIPCETSTKIEGELKLLQDKPALILADMNLEGIHKHNNYKTPGNALRNLLSGWVQGGKDCVFCLYSSHSAKDEVVKIVGGKSIRAKAIGWFDVAEDNATQADSLINEAGKHWQRCHENPLKGVWEDIRTKDWFANNHGPVPHESSDIKLGEYRSAIESVFGLSFPDEWFTDDQLNGFHESLKAMCGAYFYGRIHTPSATIPARYTFRLGSIVLIAALAYANCKREEQQTQDAPFRSFAWSTLCSSSKFTLSTSPERVRLQGQAIYEFFIQIFKSDKHSGQLRGVEVLPNGRTVKLVLSWDTKNLHNAICEELQTKCGELHRDGHPVEPGSWIHYCEGTPGTARSAYAKAHIAMAFEPGKLFGCADNVLISSLCEL